MSDIGTTRVSTRALLAYAVLALPLTMAALPVYVYVPKLYADERGLALATVGFLLLAVRTLDALQDPLLGWWSDRAAARPRGRQAFIVAAVACLGLGVLGVFRPPELAGGALAAWLALCLIVTYLGFSMGSINYFAIGAELSVDYHERTRVTAARSGFGIIGVLTAAALPEVLAGDRGLAQGLADFGLLYVPVLLLCAWAMLSGPAPRVAPARGHALAEVLTPLGNARFRWLLAVFLASGVASAIPATLVLFFVQDVLGRPDLNAVFLALYFAFGALGMPVWVGLSRRVGKKASWLAGMVMSILAFVWAFLLGPGEVVAFGMVCALSGIAYGAELALPASLLADLADEDRSGPGRRQGAYFGFWQLVEKLNLALAAGLALPLLGWAGYQPGTPQAQGGDLSAMYALVPCVLKTIALWALWRAPRDRRAATPPRDWRTSS